MERADVVGFIVVFDKVVVDCLVEDGGVERSGKNKCR